MEFAEIVQGKSIKVNFSLCLSESEHYLLLCVQSAIESLFGASMTGIAYSLFAGQPLTILGSTGPVLVFEKILFKFCKYVTREYFSTDGGCVCCLLE